MPPPRPNKPKRLAADPRALPAGTRLGHYTIERVLGRGGFGYTYLARSREANNKISKLAIKELFPDGVDRNPGSEIYVIGNSPSEGEIFEDAKNRFHAEAVALKKCRHPNVVRIIDYFPWNNTGYIVMAYEEGEQLGDYLKRKHPRGGAPEWWILEVILALLDGLTHVHQQGVFHRDIKPANIFLTANNRPVLLDFGAAKQMSQRYRYDMGKNSVLFVTDGFSPFEQYTYEGMIGAWTDLYAIGALVYKMITGSSPPKSVEREYSLKSGRDSYERLRRRRDLPAPYSPELLSAVDWALELEAGRRPQSTAQWRLRLPVPRRSDREFQVERTSLFQKTTMLLNLSQIWTRGVPEAIPPPLPLDPSPVFPSDRGKLAVTVLVALGCAIVVICLIALILNN
jgi:serine/threonine protein kinase